MNRKLAVETVVFAALVTLGVASRLVQEMNFAAVGAVGLFAGYYFRSRLAAMLVPISVMVVSNVALPAYFGWGDMLAVYASLLIPVLVGNWLRRKPTVPRCVASAIFPSVLFFGTTNFTAWLYLGYERTWVGLTECYVVALPFYWRTLSSDVMFAGGLFACYGVAVNLKWLWRVRRGRLVPVEVRRS